MKRQTLINDNYSDREISDTCYFSNLKEIKDISDCLSSSIENINLLGEIVSIVETNNVSLETYRLYSIASESILNKLGIENTNRLLCFSYESRFLYSDLNTRLSTEAIKDVLKGTMDAIMAMFKKMIDTVNSLWKDYAVATNSLKKRIEKTSKIISQLDKNDVTAQFNDTSLSSSLKRGDELNIDNQLKNTFGAIVSLNKLIDQLSTIYTHIERGIEEDQPTDKVKEIIANQDFKSILGDTNFHVTNKSEKNKNDETIATDSDYALLGNAAFYVYVNTEGASSTIDFGIKKVNVAVSSSELPVLALSQMTNYLSSLEKVISNIDTFKNKNNTLINRLKNLLSVAQKSIDEERRSVKRGNTAEESFYMSIEDDKNNTNKKDDNVDSKIKKEGTLEKKELSNGSINKQYISLIKTYIKLQGNISYMPQKVILDGSYKLMSYIDKSLAFYKK